MAPPVLRDVLLQRRTIQIIVDVQVLKVLNRKVNFHFKDLGTEVLKKVDGQNEALLVLVEVEGVDVQRTAILIVITANNLCKSIILGRILSNTLHTILFLTLILRGFSLWKTFSMLLFTKWLLRTQK